MATQAEILAEFRVAMAALTCARTGTTFKEHPNDEVFTRPPAFNAEAFVVKAGTHAITAAFGRDGVRMVEFEVNVLLGHPPLDYAESTTDHVAKDRERVADILEGRVWATAGIEAVFYERSTEQLPNDAWVVSGLVYRVIYTGGALT